MIARRFTETAPSIRRFRPAVPEAIERALRKALSRNPVDRFPTAGAFADALARPAERESTLPSVAVLPFINLSADPENEFFADGITEDVIAQLSKIRGLKVISRTSVMRYKKREQSLREVADTLGVETLLDGSVRRAGDQVRIVAQLIDAGSDQQLWAETYDRKLTDIFAIQSDVALEIASALEAELSPRSGGEFAASRRRASRPIKRISRAAIWYSRYTPEGIRKGIEYFNQAIAVDPEYALANWLAMAYAELAVGTGVRCDRRWRTVAPARRLRPRSHGSPSLARPTPCSGCSASLIFRLGARGSRVQARAGAQPRSGRHLRPLWLALRLARAWDEALALVKRAEELDPLMHRAMSPRHCSARAYYEASRRRSRRWRSIPHGGRTPRWAGPHQARAGGRGAEPVSSERSSSIPATRCTSRNSAKHTRLAGKTRRREDIASAGGDGEGAIRLAVPRGLRLHGVGRR